MIFLDKSKQFQVTALDKLLIRIHDKYNMATGKNTQDNGPIASVNNGGQFVRTSAHSLADLSRYAPWGREIVQFRGNRGIDPRDL